MKKVIILLVVCLGFSTINETKAQISIDGQVNFQRMSIIGGMTGIGLRGEYAQTEKIGFRVGFDYFFGNSTDYETSASSFSSQTTPDRIDVNYTESISMINITAGGKYYFVGDYEEDFGVYGLLDVGLMLAPVKYEYGSYDESLYDVYEGENTMLFNFSIGGGVGAEYKVGPGSVFSNLYLSLPANNVGDMIVEVSIPPAVGLSLGYRYMFDI